MFKNQKSPFFCLSNLVSHEVKRRNIIDMEDEEKLPNKAAFRDWQSKFDTCSCFFNCVQGESPGERVSTNNPPTFLHGIVADYDTRLSEDERQKMLADAKVKPVYISSSYSGGTHAVWLFENPLPIPSEAVGKEILNIARRELGLNNMFGPLDEKAYSLTQYLHRGWNWQQGGGSPIPSKKTYAWIAKALDKADLTSLGQEIPLEIVKEALEKSYPGCVPEPFEKGVRCRRFWSPEADCENAAELTTRGFICYTGPTGFMSWEYLLPESVLAEYAANTTGAAFRDFFFVDNEFWVKMKMTADDGSQHVAWNHLSRQNALSTLTVDYRISNKAKRGEDSEAKRLLDKIVAHKSLAGYLPLVYCSEAAVTLKQAVYLNTSTVEAMPPAKEGGEFWGDGFPDIAEFLEGLFDPPAQLDYFLSWLSYFYTNARNHIRKQGQALFIAGNQGSGKTFTSRCIIGPLMGGREDASSYLSSKTPFNGGLADSGVWYVDDATPLSEARQRSAYAANIKRLVSNPEIRAEEKFRKAVTIPWCGRLVVTLNLDPECISLLPDADEANADKVMFLKTTDKKLDRPKFEEIVASQLPAFAAYLLKYEIPEHCRGGVRFGVKTYLHPEMLREASQNGGSGTFAEIFTSFLEDYFNKEQHAQEFSGTASVILSLMQANEPIRGLIQGSITAYNIGSRLGQIKRKRYPITSDTSGRATVWTVTREDFNKYKGRIV